MKTYNIYKKRDGQSFKNVSSILADNFTEACKKFARQMTDDNWNQSNNVQWLTKEDDGVNETGWYDFGGGLPLFNEETEKYDADEAANFLLVSEKDINEGFSSWSEDVYTWELREPLEYVEIYDLEDFENEKENYAFFMAFDGHRFYLYNGDFSEIAIEEGLGRQYDQYDDMFMGSGLDDIDFIKSYFE
jgi:hypothetical protein